MAIFQIRPNVKILDSILPEPVNVLTASFTVYTPRQVMVMVMGWEEPDGFTQTEKTR